jgi:hypothetical protein
VAGSPVGWSESLGRRLRVDGPETVGVSTQTLAEEALTTAGFAVAADLGAYLHEEMTRINEALYTWLVEILAFRAEKDGVGAEPALDEARRVVSALRGYDPGAGDLTAFLAGCGAGDADAATERLELMRVRTAAVHDHLVHWIQQLLTDLAARHDDDAVLAVVLRTYETLWGPRYATWNSLPAIERLQLSVEGMRGHLSGPRHRGDVGVIDDDERYVMVLDPCGSCGVLRRGDPDSGRPPANPAGTTRPHPWSWGRVGLGWYAVHSAIVMEWLQTSAGHPPMRPLVDCDTQSACRWFVYKDPAAARPEVVS